jgi:hypothetical protein
MSPTAPPKPSGDAGDPVLPCQDYDLEIVCDVEEDDDDLDLACEVEQEEEDHMEVSSDLEELDPDSGDDEDDNA